MTKETTTASVLTYRFYIEREFKARCRRNPSYSLRAYARDLDVPPSKLSEVIRRTTGLSAVSATKMAKHLKLTEKETEHFITLVEAEHSRSSARKEQARNLLLGFQALNGFTEVDLEKFKVISDWHHNALLEVLTLENAPQDTEALADHLGIETELVAEALARLEKFHLIARDNDRWLIRDLNTSTPGGVPSREIREHHFQILQKATASIEGVQVEERDLSSITLAIDEKDFPLARKRILEFRRALAQELQAGSIRNRVYCLAVQFFPLSKKRETHEN